MSTILLGVSVTMVSTFLNHLVTRLFLKPKDMKGKMEELKNFRMELVAAKRLKDQKLIKKLDKQQLYMSQIEKEVSSFQIKMMAVSLATSLLPFILIGYLVPMNSVAGYFPALLFPGEDKISLSFYFWYFICISFFMQVFRKALGT